MHFYRSRSIPKLLQGAVSRHCVGDKNVNAFGNSPLNEEKLLTSRKDDKKYLYQIPPWLRKSQKPIQAKIETQNEIILKENNRCKSVYKINRKISPVPKHPQEKVQSKLEEKIQSKLEETPKPKLTPHFSPSAINLDSPVKRLHNKKLKVPAKVDPFQLTTDPYQFSDPVLNFTRKSNLKKKPKTLLDTLVQKKKEEKKLIDKKETERREFKKIDKVINSKVEVKGKPIVEGKQKKSEVKKRTNVPKSFEHMSAKSAEDKKKMWKDIIESLELHDVTNNTKVKAFSKNKLADGSNRPVKLSSNEMLYSKGVEKKNTRQETNKSIPNMNKVKVENSTKAEQSASASSSIKNIKDRKSQAFSESVIILRKEGERLRKEYERSRSGKRTLDGVRANGKLKQKLDKTETKEHIINMREKMNSQASKLSVLKNQKLNFTEQKMELKNEKKIKTVFPHCRNEPLNKVSKPIIKEAVASNNNISKPSSSKVKPETPRLPSFPNMNMVKLADAKDKKNPHSMVNIPARLILPKYPNSTVFDNKFSKDGPRPQSKNEPKDPKKNEPFQTKPIDVKKIIQVSENNENVVKINESRVSNTPENVYCLPMGLVKGKDVKIPKEIDSLQEMLNNDEEPNSDISRLPKEIKDALIRIGKPNLNQFAILPQPRSTDMDYNLKKALINFQVDQAKLSSQPQQKLIPETSVQSECDFSKFGTKLANKKMLSKPWKNKTNSSESSEIPKTEVKDSEIKTIQGKRPALHLLIRSKAQDLFSKYKCYFHTTIRTLDMNRKIKLEKEKNSILPYGGGNVLNKIRSQTNKSFANLKPPKKISKVLKPKVLRNGKYRRNLYNKSNNYYIKIKTKPAKRKTINMEKVHEFLEPMSGLDKKTIQPPPAMAYSEVLSAIYTKKGVSKYA